MTSEDYRHMNQMLAASGEKAIQALMWLNGGAVLLTLNFISNVLRESAPHAGASPTNTSGLGAALVLFALGALLGAVSAGTTYLTSFCYLASNVDQEAYRDLPFWNKWAPQTAKGWLVGGSWLHIATVGLVILGYVFFVAGVIAVQARL